MITAALTILLLAQFSSATVLELKLFDLKEYPEARCNDGTPSGYYVKESPGSNDYLIFQQGGGWAYNADTCKSRSTDLMSSKDWQATVSQSGIFESQDSRLAKMNLIYVPYCSSDGWSGSTQSNNNECGFYFNGHDIVTAVIQEVVKTHNLGSNSGTRVMYGGCSAGARGALFNIDRVEALLNTLVPSGNIEFFGGLLDSCLWVDLPQLSSAKDESFQNQTRAVVALANATASIPSECAKKFPELWQCLFGEYRLPFTKSNYFLHSFQYDLFQLQGDTGVAIPNSTPEQLAYDESFRNRTVFTVNDETIYPKKPGSAALLPACFKHCNTQTSTFSTLKTNGVSLEMAVSSWFYETKLVPQYIVETCKGFNCGLDCPAP